MANARKVVIEFVGDDKSLGKTLGGIESKTSGLGGKLAKFGKMAALGLGAAGIAGAAAGVKLYQMGDDALDARDRIGQIAKSMGIFGNQAGAVTDRLVNLADATARQTGVDQNQIKAAQAKLLTFKDLAKTADSAGGAFDRATQAAIDMGAAGFGDASTNAVQLGKALNDPIKGISALAKSGVTFTEQEKERIKVMVESGKIGKAQAMILGAIESQVGGTAKAMSGPMDRLRIVASQAGEQLGAKLVPAVDSVVRLFLNEGLPALKKFGDYLQVTMPPIFQRIGAVIESLRAPIRSYYADLFAMTRSVLDAVSAIWDKFGGNITQFAVSSFKSIMTIVRGAFEVIRGIFQTVSALLRGDWKGVWEGIKMILRGAVKIVVGVVGQMWNLVRFAFKNAGVMIRGIFSGMWEGIKTLARNGADWLVGQVKAIPGRLLNAGKAFLNAGKGLIGKFWEGMKSIGSGVAGLAGDIFGSIARMLNGVIRGINNGIPDKISIKGAPDINLPDNPFPTIPGYAKGTNFHRGGPAIVGERGPELVDLPRGARVTPHKQSMGALGAVGGGDQSVTVILQLDGKEIQRALLRRKRLSGGAPLGLA